MSLYDILLTSWKQERTQAEIISVDSEFFNKCREYIKHLESQSNTEADSLMKHLFEERWRRTNFLFNDFMRLRVDKIIQKILQNQSIPSSISEEEKFFIDSFKINLDRHQNGVIGIDSDIVEGDLSEEVNEGLQFVVFLEDDNQVWLGADFKSYGPFSKNDIVLMPKINAVQFFNKSKVKFIDINR